MVSPAVLKIILSGYVCPEARAFLARAGGFGGPYRRAYINLINGLVKDGAWDILDVLYVFATQDQTTALLNLVSTSHAATLTGTPTFTASQGFTGLVTASNHVTGPAQNALSKYVRDSAHLSAWIYTGSSQNRAVINDNSIQRLTPNNAGNASCRINESAGAAVGTTANGGRGYYLGTRSGPSAYALYVNGSLAGSDTTASVGMNASAYQIPQSTGTIGPISIITMGADATAVQDKMFARFAAFMTAIGQPVVP